MRGSLLESEKQHQDVPMLDRKTEIQRKMNNSNDFQSDVHPQHLPGSPHSLGLQHNRQVGIILSARRLPSIFLSYFFVKIAIFYFRLITIMAASLGSVLIYELDVVLGNGLMQESQEILTRQYQDSAFDLRGHHLQQIQ